MKYRILVLLLAGIFGSPPVSAQRVAWQDQLLPYRRHILVRPLEVGVPAVVTSQFFTHGALASEKHAIAVYARSQQVPSRVLQIGPGDLCHVAFQTRESESQYQIYYGGAEATEASPEWTARDGLLLETRKWSKCDLDQLSAVRQTYQSAERLGSGYVQQVFHRHNPFDVQPAPFISHYSGRIQIPSTGLYSFFTSSQDCSFLLIDGKPVVSSPGRHRPIGRARYRGKIRLGAGSYPFDYWHAASGTETCAVAAWQVPGAKRLAVIPPSAFGSDRIARFVAQRPEHEKDGPFSDLHLAIRGEAPIEDSDQWAVLVEFEGAGAATGRNGTCTWEFGDGQTGDGWQPVHVYLHPGEYLVTLHVRQRGNVYKSTNRVRITRFIQRQAAKNADKIDAYLPIIDTYDLTTLDAHSLLQLVLVRIQATEWTKAFETGMHALVPGGSSEDDPVRWEIATLLGPVTSRQLQDSHVTFRLWNAAGKSIRDPRRRVQCALAAADVALNELLQPADARPFLDFAQQHLHDATGTETANLYRIWGDWHARSGDAKAAWTAYQKAAGLRSLALSVTQQSARRGAFSRSTEAFLRDRDLVHASEQLSQWQRDYPLDKTKGYLSTLLARYWLARGKPQVGIAVAEDLLTVSPRSPYADRLVVVKATAEETLGRTDRAIAAYQSLLTDYPGSPLRKLAKEKLAALKPENEE